MAKKLRFGPGTVNVLSKERFRQVQQEQKARRSARSGDNAANLAIERGLRASLNAKIERQTLPPPGKRRAAVAIGYDNVVLYPLPSETHWADVAVALRDIAQNRKLERQFEAKRRTGSVYVRSSKDARTKNRRPNRLTQIRARYIAEGARPNEVDEVSLSFADLWSTALQQAIFQAERYGERYQGAAVLALEFWVQ